MSLVYEALRKAEREKERHSGGSALPGATGGPIAPGRALPQTPAPPVAPPTPAPRRGARNYLSVLILIVSLLAVAALAYVVVVVTKSIPTSRAEDAGTRSVASAAPAVVPAPVPASPSAPAASAAVTTANDPRFKLTGIMGWPDGGFGAVINGKTVREDHYIDGAIVKKIERDRVTLDFNGQPVVLRLY
jgi:hypothetical protein